ncbi:MBL fold metallo-hydrolase [Archangium lansingense]|uniref:MBL fold metallo-hydrolase n=1 Tax=Archangium lansingense TaxID=2995310 RepID=UPI003B7A5B36
MPVLCTACAGARAPAAGAPASAAEEPPPIRLYVLDCGRIEIKDMGFFSGSGEPTGQAGTLTVPCFLIRHPQGVFLWDTGLSDSIAQAPGADPVGNQTYVDTPLSTQLRQLGLDHRDVRYVAFSHLHADYAGNANAFTSSTWILQRRELDWATQTPTPLGVDVTVFSAHRTAKLQQSEGFARSERWTSGAAGARGHEGVTQAVESPGAGGHPRTSAALHHHHHPSAPRVECEREPHREGEASGACPPGCHGRSGQGSLRAL